MAERLAVSMRQSGYGAEFVYSSFGTRRYRKPHLVAARDAKLRFLEVWSGLADEIVQAAEQVLGPDNYLYREWDDEFVDILIPGRQWLATNYPGLDLDWLTEFADEGPF